MSLPSPSRAALRGGLASWIDNPKPINLIDILRKSNGANAQLVKNIPGGKKILMDELTGNQSPRDSRLSMNAESASVITYIVNTDAWEDPLLQEILTKTICGGWWEPGGSITKRKYPPLRHPYHRNQWAKDIVQGNPQGITTWPTQQLDMNPYAAYKMMQVTVSFETRPYSLIKPNFASGYTAINPNWIRCEGHGQSTRVGIPFGWYRFTSNNRRTNLGLYLIRPEQLIQMQIFQVPSYLLFSGTNSRRLFTQPDGKAWFATVNSHEFFGFPPTTLLLKDFDFIPHGDISQDYELNTAIVNFHYNSWGWNKQVDSVGNLGDVSWVGDPAKAPFELANFDNFLNTINPIV